MKKSVVVTVISITLAVILLFAACGQNGKTDATGENAQKAAVTGTVATDGSTAKQKGIGALGEAFMAENSGIGIAPDQQERIFERFYRVDKSHSKETGGTGLGISIVKHAVQYLNGQISVESRENAGAVFTVVL